MAAEPESLLPLPRLTDPDELDEPEELLREESDEPDESEESGESDEPEDDEDDEDDGVPVVAVELACATAATPIVPPTLSASRVPVATASRRRPFSRLLGLAPAYGSCGVRSCAFIRSTIGSPPVHPKG